MLNILICHLKGRERQLKELLDNLDSQIAMFRDEVSYIIETDNGDIPVGKKRNMLVKKATREFVAFVDDDDQLSPSYVVQIVNAIRRGEDKYGHLHCVGMCGYMFENGVRTWQFRHSVTVDNWCKDRANRIYFRPPNHLNPIRRQYVLQCPFPEIRIGEDRVFSDKVKLLLANEIFIEEPIYYYLQGNK